jgi:hypothetical protein
MTQTEKEGDWQHWYVTNGALNETAGTPPSCSTTVSIDEGEDLTEHYQVGNEIQFTKTIDDLRVIDSGGRTIRVESNINKTSLEGLSQGLYFLHLISGDQRAYLRVLNQ